MNCFANDSPGIHGASKPKPRLTRQTNASTEEAVDPAVSRKASTRWVRSAAHIVRSGPSSTASQLGLSDPTCRRGWSAAVGLGQIVNSDVVQTGVSTKLVDPVAGQMSTVRQELKLRNRWTERPRRQRVGRALSTHKYSSVPRPRQKAASTAERRQSNPPVVSSTPRCCDPET
jgi:hypothetical protein